MMMLILEKPIFGKIKKYTKSVSNANLLFQFVAYFIDSLDQIKLFPLQGVKYMYLILDQV